MTNDRIGDPDNPEWTAADFAGARPVSERHGAEFARSLVRPKDRPATIPGERKQAVSIRIDREVLDRFRAGGPGWQTRMNDALAASTSLAVAGVGAGMIAQHRLATLERLAA
jgi:uncharacterized protein (DUF4415 family)